MQYDRFQEQRNVWFLWVIANTIGCSIGWAGGEFVGQIVYHRYGWTIGHLAGWSIFEASVWLMRWSVLRRIPTVKLWRQFDAQIWVSSELLAWSIGEGFRQFATTLWVTMSAVWGVVGGAGIWLIFAAIRQARPGRWWAVRATGYALLGLIGGQILIVATLLLTDEVRRIGETLNLPILASLIGGAILGLATGSMTGLAVARLWLKTAAPDHS